MCYDKRENGVKVVSKIKIGLLPSKVLSELWVLQNKKQVRISAFYFWKCILIFGYLWYD